jgi:hypothetical protein
MRGRTIFSAPSFLQILALSVDKENQGFIAEPSRLSHRRIASIFCQNGLARYL